MSLVRLHGELCLTEPGTGKYFVSFSRWACRRDPPETSLLGKKGYVGAGFED